MSKQPFLNINQSRHFANLTYFSFIKPEGILEKQKVEHLSECQEDDYALEERIKLKDVNFASKTLSSPLHTSSKFPNSRKVMRLAMEQQRPEGESVRSDTISQCLSCDPPVKQENKEEKTKDTGKEELARSEEGDDLWVQFSLFCKVIPISTSFLLKEQHKIDKYYIYSKMGHLTGFIHYRDPIWIALNGYLPFSVMKHFQNRYITDRYRRPLRIVNKAFSRERPAYIRNKLHP
ncbi:hypothetical protein MJG53_017604 [Ovis ammon polii x Ovis aries]|uniref:Uncharacterized protein n=1 Tax=Ovis ammon polii x Ovis aries TaxID=2918886 RepID=A0ACB9U8A5_9CETA|nr:hypothetical protein MJG53_017604 [Ovis ammon polii x Ovis aries]